MNTALLAISMVFTAQAAFAGQPEGLPRHASDAERVAESARPGWMAIDRGPGTTPSGTIVCPGEYGPMEGIVLSYHPSYSTGVLTIVRTMAAQITTTGQAKAYVVFGSAPSAATLGMFQSAGADMSRLIPIVNTLDSIWMRDYGPRYIYEGVDAGGNGGCRAIIDHTYNRTQRTLDDVFPAVFAVFRDHARYVIPLIHGGGNHHLDSLGRGFATRLIANENPQLGATSAQREAAVSALWSQYQGLGTTITDPFPTTVDLTQHIDMWAQIIAHDKVMLSQWPTVAPGNATYEPYRITEAQAAALAAPAGPYTVFRVPARLVGTTHYTYTNVVMCNNLVLIPSYTNASVSPLNLDAEAAWRAALPGHTIVPVPCQSIVGLAGVMHCIAMHVPAHRGHDDGSGNLAPTVFVRSPAPAQSLAAGPGSPTIPIRWTSDDDAATTTADIHLSLDGGATYPVPIALGIADSGSFTWAAPNYFSRNARIRITVRDNGSPARSGSDEVDAVFTLAGSCRADVNNSLSLSVQDVFDFLSLYFAGDAAADFNDAGGLSVQDVFDFLAAYFTGCA